MPPLICFLSRDDPIPSVTAPSPGDSIEKQMEQLTIDTLPVTFATTTISVIDTTAAADTVPDTTTASTDSSLATTPHATYSSSFYPPSYLCVIDEPKDASLSKDMHHAQNLLKQYQKEEPDTGSKLPSKGKSSGGEGYEKAAVKHGDKAFNKFHKQIEKCPHQLIR